MEIISGKSNIDFLGRRQAALVLSVLLITASLASLVVRGLNFGIDFTGGTLLEIRYQQPVEIEGIRSSLTQAGFGDAVVQHFGTAKDILVRLPTRSQPDLGEAPARPVTSAQLSNSVMDVLHQSENETPLESVDAKPGDQQCTVEQRTQTCTVQVRRVEFVGPQVGDELTNKGGLAMLYALAGILIYITLRFRWQFAIGSIVALVHDITITVGAFSLFQFEFSLAVLAALLAVIGYSLNDTIVVFDRIRENFRKMRKSEVITVLNNSINQTLPRTVLTSLTTLMVVLSLLIFGGEVIRGFSIALLVGVLVGTYSSIFVASPAVLMLGVTRADMLPVVKEGAEAEAELP